jgi:hypothetical protein
MPKGRFLGSVLPLTARISIPEIPYATCYGEGGLVLDLEISISNWRSSASQSLIFAPMILLASSCGK